MMPTINRREDGFVSLITAILICLLLLTITTSLIAVQTLTLRQAENTEESQKAYYAAESGAEDAIAKVNTGAIVAGSNQSCSSPNAVNTNLDPSASGQVGWTCQAVTFSGSPSGKLITPDAAITVDPYNPATSSSISKMVLRWDQSSGAHITPSYLASRTWASYPSSTGYGQHAMPLELTVVDYPTGSFAAAAIKTQNLLILPSYNAGGNATYSVAGGVCAAGATCGVDGRNPFHADCTTAGTADASGNSTTNYHCEITISSLTPSHNYLFRIRSLYLADGDFGFSGSGQFVMNFYNSAGTLLAPPNQVATIDVTGKAGTVYRRVIYKQPVGPEAQSNLNYTLFADGNLCKDYTVVGGVRPGGADPCAP
ncbi:hypothetical protein HJC99_01930 [Candidatus Saccharibacteria bacterium]|nr:hypothetical protein [Candidatus Saccharibacteria bacterium]